MNSTENKIVLLLLLISMKLSAQLSVPNGTFDAFQSVFNKEHSYELPMAWKEHPKNTKWRQRDGHGFAYKYQLPDANGTALALFRGSSLSHVTERNTIYTYFKTNVDGERTRLVGRYKFSGSDIEGAKDTLAISVLISKKPLDDWFEDFPKETKTIKLHVSQAKFDNFYLDVGAIEKDSYVTIAIQLISGSDDSYYFGYSHAVLDDLKFVKSPKTATEPIQF